MDIRILDTDEIEYLARVFTQAHERGAKVRVAMENGLKVAAGSGMWTPGMGTRVNDEFAKADLARY